MENEKLIKICNAAEELFREKGYTETKISDIAAKAGVSIGTIYNYYKNKDELFNSLGIPELKEYRPEQELKKQDILNTALLQFGQKGYNKTTMDDIASHLGLSKSAIYQYFNSKEDIFSSIFQQTDIKSIVSNLNQSQTSKNYTDSLVEIGFEFLSMYSRPERVNLLRVIISESPQFPEVGKLVYNSTINEAHKKVANYLEQHEEVGDINSKFAARAYLGMLLSFVIVDKLITSSEGEFSNEEIVTGVMDIFLNGIKNRGRD